MSPPLNPSHSQAREGLLIPLCSRPQPLSPGLLGGFSFTTVIPEIQFYHSSGKAFLFTPNYRWILFLFLSQSALPPPPLSSCSQMYAANGTDSASYYCGSGSRLHICKMWLAALSLKPNHSQGAVIAAFDCADFTRGLGFARACLAWRDFSYSPPVKP